MMNDTPDQASGDTFTWESYQLMGYHGSSSDKDRVEHDYHDHSKDNDLQDLYHPGMSFHLLPNLLGGRGPEQTFPMKLHAMLEQIEKDGLASVVSWQTHGRCFVVHQPEEFVAHILPRWFRQSKFPSFQRQLNMYGFKRITSGRDKGGYYHELFLRERKFLCLRIQRLKIKGTGVRKPSSPETEPDFYHMKFLPKLGSKENLAGTNSMVLIDPGEMNAAPLVQQGAVASSQNHFCPPVNLWGRGPQLSTQQGPFLDSQGLCFSQTNAWIEDQQKSHAPLPPREYWSFCEPRPMAEKAVSRNPRPLPGSETAALTRNESEQQESSFKTLPSPPNFSLASAFQNNLRPVMPFARAVIPAPSAPRAATPSTTPQSSSLPSGDDLDCQFDFDEAMESLLKIPMPSTFPSEMTALAQAYPMMSTEP